MHHSIRLLALVGLLAAGCAGRLVEPTTADALRGAGQFPGTTVEDLTRGRRRYIEQCSSCHALVPPHKKPAEAWPALVREMSERGKMSEEEVRDITRYLVIASAAPRQ